VDLDDSDDDLNDAAAGGGPSPFGLGLDGDEDVVAGVFTDPKRNAEAARLAQSLLELARQHERSSHDRAGEPKPSLRVAVENLERYCDELENRRVAVIDDEWGGDCLCLFDDETGDVTVVQPNEDGSYWRKVVRNKMYRMKEMRRVKAAKNYFQKMKGEDVELNVLSSYGPYTGTAGQVMGISTRAINPKAVAKN